jgi:hypothetical protein
MKFTMKMEEENKLLLLDVLIKRKPAGLLDIQCIENQHTTCGVWAPLNTKKGRFINTGAPCKDHRRYGESRSKITAFEENFQEKRLQRTWC